MYKRIVNLTAGAILFGYASSSLSAVLQDIKFSELPGEKAQIKLTFDEPPLKPQSYSIDQPARVVIDFPDVSSALSQKKYAVSVGDVDSAVALEAGGRTRLILNLSNSTPFNAVAAGNSYIIEVGSGGSSNSIASSPVSNSAAPTTNTQASNVTASSPSVAVRSGVPNISGIDFRRGEKDEGKVIIDLTDPRVKVDVQEVSGGIDIKFINTFLPNQLRRKLDVVDFATPVNLVGASYQTDGTTISVKTRGEYDYLAYQADNQYVLSVKPLTPKQVADKKAKFAYTGEKLSLSFQDIDVRSVLQIIADFNNLNLVASDTVTGNITLRLDNVPWDQALDLVLKTKGLDKRQVGTVLMVAPAAEIAERERQEIETKKQLQELAPLRTEYIRVKYANARELFNLFISEQGGQGDTGGGAGGSSAGGGANGDQRNSTGTILSERGQAIVDERTNSIILTDTDDKIAEFKSLVDQIDIPIRQVMIEARIVIASNDFSKELGSRIYTIGQDNLTGAGTPTSVGRIGGRLETFISDDGGQGGGANTIDLADATAVDLGVFDPAGALTYTLINSKIELGLEISALEEAGYGEVVSQPKVITGDKQKATISSGTEIGFQSESASGGTTVSFKEAALKLDVVPQITPDNRIIMDLIIEQNSVGEIVAGIPTLDITELTTQVLVNDGETVVLGGVYTTNTLKQETKIPFLGDIPYLGRLFRKNTQQDNKSEILIFVTPRIMSEKIRN